MRTLIAIVAAPPPEQVSRLAAVGRCSDPKLSDLVGRQTSMDRHRGLSGSESCEDSLPIEDSRITR